MKVHLVIYRQSYGIISIVNSNCMVNGADVAVVVATPRMSDA